MRQPRFRCGAHPRWARRWTAVSCDGRAASAFVSSCECPDTVRVLRAALASMASPPADGPLAGSAGVEAGLVFDDVVRVVDGVVRAMMRVFTMIRLLMLGAVLAGVPLLLVLAWGDPLPSRLPTMAATRLWANDPLQVQFMVPAVRALAWVLWLVVSGAVVAGALARVRRWRWSRLARYLPGPLQGLAAALLGAATVSATPAAPAHATVDAGPTQARLVGDVVHRDAGDDRSPVDAVKPAPGVGAEELRAGSAGAPRAAAPSYTVRRGDTLSSIARQCLGDADRWPEIFTLNRGTRFPHVGGTLRDADVIYPGWRLTLPAKAPAAEQTSPRLPTAPPPAPPTGPADTPGVPPEAAPPSPAPSDGPATPHDGAPGVSGPASETPTGGIADGDGRQHAAAGIDLPSGSWVEAGLAAALAAAATLVWRHRRRRYRRRPVSPELRLDDPDLAAMPAVVTQIRRRLHIGHASGDTDAAATWTLSHATPAAPAVSRPRTGPADPPRTGQDPDPATPATDDAGPAREADTAATRRPVAPSLTNPAAVWPSSGLGLTGPGAESAARGFLAAALADHDPDAPPGTVVLPSTTAATLLGAAAVTLPRSPRLVVTDDLADALTLLEQQILHRSRLVYAHEVDTVAAMRTADPYEEPTPPLLLIADAAGNHERVRISALLAQGQRLDVHGILLGDWPTGDTVVVDADGATTPGDGARHGHHPADVGRLTVLTPTETVAVITTLTEAHTGLPQPPVPVEPRRHQHTGRLTPASSDTADTVVPLDEAGRVLAALADLGDVTAAAIAAQLGLPYPAATARLVQWEHTGHAETIRTHTGRTLWRLTTTGRDALARFGPAPVTDPANTDPDPVADQPVSGTRTSGGEPPHAERHPEIGAALQWPDPATTFTSEPAEPNAPQTDDSTGKPGHVEVTVLGDAGIVATAPDRRPRRKALELLVYLAVHDGSATVEAILDDLLPDAPASKASERLHTYVSDLRSVMRRIGGPATYLTHPHQRYTLNPDTIDIDLWRMRAAIRRSHQATDPRQRIDALQQAVDAYRGPLADGADYEWAEPYREAIRRQALDAHLALADAFTGDPAAQARVLEAAIGHSPYSEHLYQQAMRARAALGHLDAVRTLLRALGRALAEIDAEPGDDTITLADRLVADLQRPGRRSDIETTIGTN
jgi:DNA-binding SARP family transcriptional activator